MPSYKHTRRTSIRRTLNKRRRTPRGGFALPPGMVSGLISTGIQALPTIANAFKRLTGRDTGRHFAPRGRLF